MSSRCTGALVGAALLVFGAGCESPTDVSLLVLPATLEAVGDTARLEARVEGSDRPVRWESLDPDIVTVTEDGLATAVKAGMATVVARVGSSTDEGAVEVLPPVDVQVLDPQVVADPSGKHALRLRLRNAGGRGFYRMELWVFDISQPGGHRLSQNTVVDLDAPVGLDVQHTSYGLDELPDWIVVRSREPLGTEHRRTSCVRLDGAGGCPSDDPVVVHSVAISPTAAVMEVGDSLLYQVFAYDAGGTLLPGRIPQWEIVTPTIIGRSESGYVRALAAGYGEVRATIEGVTAAVAVTVTEREP